MTWHAAVPRPTLRPMRWWDLPRVLDLENALFPEDAWSAGMFWSELADTRRPAAGRDYLVAELPGTGRHDGRIVGYAGLMAVGDSADVQTIAVAREAWGAGIGTALLRALIDAAAGRGCRELLLEVRVDNDRAKALYERHGFVGVGLRRGYYQPAGVDALVMRLTEPAASRHRPRRGEARL